MFSFIFNIFKRKKTVAKKKPVLQMEASEKAYNIIKEFEGLRLKAYQCSARKWTIGYGSTRYKDGRAVTEGDVLTSPAEAEELLSHHLINNTCKDIKNYINVPLTQNQFDALCSFVYNTGTSGVYGYFKDNGKLVKRHSILAQKLNSEDYTGAADALRAWVFADGKRNPGLVRRREAERELFLS